MVRLLTIDQIKKNMEDFSKSVPELYKEYVKKDAILEPERQIQLAQLDELQFLDYIMDRNTMEHLNIYPENANKIMRDFSEEIFEGLKNLRDFDDFTAKELSDLRVQLGDKAKLIELSDDYKHTLKPRGTGDTMRTGELEHKIAKAIYVPGPRFLATTTKGYYGFVRFYEEEVGRIAPENANAYRIGNTWCLSIEKGMASSPIIAGEYRNVGLKNGEYHVIPLKFFHVEGRRIPKPSYMKKPKIKEKPGEESVAVEETYSKEQDILSKSLGLGKGKELF
jgi:hypothetical protein